MSNMDNGEVPPSGEKPFDQIVLVKLVVVLVVITFVPSALRYSFDLSSFAPGLVIAAIIVWGMSAIGMINAPAASGLGHIAVVALYCALIAAHVVLTYMLGEPDLQRPFTSLVLLMLFLVSSRYVGYTIFTPGYEQRRGLAIILVAFAIMAVLGLLGFVPRSQNILERPIYPFTEPSHFAFTVMPFLIYGVVVSNRIVRMLILAIAAIAVILLKSLSLAVGLILAGACCLDGIALVIFLLTAFAGLGLLDLSYFTDRLDFAYGNENLSMLVYRQGVELIRESLVQTWGWGIGFQRLGFTNLFTVTSNIIYALTQGDLNLRDGGFIAAKLIAEFGIIGVILILLYLRTMVRSIFRLRRVAGRRERLPDGTVFALSCFVGFAIELFVRGAGYFTSTALLAIAAIPYIRAASRKVIEHASI